MKPLELYLIFVEESVNVRHTSRLHLHQILTQKSNMKSESELEHI